MAVKGAPKRIDVTRFLAVLLTIGLLLPAPVAPQASSVEQSAGTKPDATVWANTLSGVYHCEGTRWYGRTSNGEYMTEKQAQDHGYRAAAKKACGTLGLTPAPLGELITPEKVVTQCGRERWPVKILLDKDREQVELTPTETTIATLSSIPKHNLPYPYDHRIGPEELKVYRIKAKLLRVRLEQDSDFHVLLADSADEQSRMIAEIPAPECALGTGHEDEYRAARDAVSKLSQGSFVEVEGVGFFDFLHDQDGAAPNAIELHPVLRVRPLETSALK